jgi:hypothetical protein
MKHRSHLHAGWVVSWLFGIALCGCTEARLAEDSVLSEPIGTTAGAKAEGTSVIESTDEALYSVCTTSAQDTCTILRIAGCPVKVAVAYCDQANGDSRLTKYVGSCTGDLANCDGHLHCGPC